MKPTKYTASETKVIDLETKIIYKYPTPTKRFDIGKMIVKGRHPKKTNQFIVEHECEFVMYILSGSGKFYAGDEILEVKKEDVVFIPKNTPFACEGYFEYITVDIPAFYLNQSEEITL